MIHRVQNVSLAGVTKRMIVIFVDTCGCCIALAVVEVVDKTAHQVVRVNGEAVVEVARQRWSLKMKFFKLFKFTEYAVV